MRLSTAGRQGPDIGHKLIVEVICIWTFIQPITVITTIYLYLYLYLCLCLRLRLCLRPYLYLCLRLSLRLYLYLYLYLWENSQNVFCKIFSPYCIICPLFKKKLFGDVSYYSPVSTANTGCCFKQI